MALRAGLILSRHTAQPPEVTRSGSPGSRGSACLSPSAGPTAACALVPAPAAPLASPAPYPSPPPSSEAASPPTHTPGWCRPAWWIGGAPVFFHAEAADTDKLREQCPSPPPATF
eukprot:3177833-Pleurochrysis_carterae.AAC.1